MIAAMVLGSAARAVPLRLQYAPAPKLRAAYALPVARAKLDVPHCGHGQRAKLGALTATLTSFGAVATPAALASTEVLSLASDNGTSPALLAVVGVETLAVFALGSLYLQMKEKLELQESALVALLDVRRSLQRLQLDTVYAQTTISGGSKEEETSTEASLSKSAESTLQDAMLGNVNPDSLEALTVLREAKRALAESKLAEAERLYSNALRMAQTAEDVLLMKRAYRGLGVTCRDLRRFDEAINYLNKALEMSQVLDSQQGFSSGPSQRDIELCGMIADIQVEQGNVKEAQAMYKRYVSGLEILGENVRQGPTIPSAPQKQAV
mmetsp:Transcript_3188/g.11543  ORF Transcript_3188/g.11543 Transcript_3188/m.11543 type:complete len:324 (+) Transcript_3188:34-1005(+)